jgi:glycosyltransferase involved in cell wall biosynthesis
MQFSIIIPTYNRPAQLQNCLQALCVQQYSLSAFEVIVVNDGGRQQPDAVVAAFADRLNVKLVHQKNAGPGTARNHGASLAAGQYLLFTDDDCQPAAGWLQAYAVAIADHPQHMLGGQTLNGLIANPYANASQKLQSWFYDYCANHNPAMLFFASNNLCLPRDKFIELGGFDTATLRYASEDRELCGRWRAAGHALIFADQALIYHYHPLHALSYLAQHFSYGRGAYRLRVARRKQGLPVLPGDPQWLLASISRYPLSEPDYINGLTVASLIICTHAANILGYFYERIMNSCAD